MTGRPALSQTHVPSYWKKEPGSYDPPQAALRLGWVYGYRGHDTRQNVFYNSKGEVVYHAAAVGIVYNPSSETQRHITDDPDSDDVAEGNSDDILCMAGRSGVCPPQHSFRHSLFHTRVKTCWLNSLIGAY